MKMLIKIFGVLVVLAFTMSACQKDSEQEVTPIAENQVTPENKKNKKRASVLKARPGREQTLVITDTFVDCIPFAYDCSNPVDIYPSAYSTFFDSNDEFIDNSFYDNYSLATEFFLDEDIDDVIDNILTVEIEYSEDGDKFAIFYDNSTSDPFVTYPLNIN